MSVQSWLVGRLGAIALMFALGVSMTGIVNPKIGIALTTIGCAWAAIDYWGQFQRQGERAVGISGIALVWLLFIWFSFVSAPLVIVADVPKGNYAAGDIVYGIKWKAEYSPINVIMNNDTGYDYNNFELFVRTNQTYISQPGIKAGKNHCIATEEFATAKDFRCKCFNPS